MLNNTDCSGARGTLFGTVAHSSRGGDRLRPARAPPSDAHMSGKRHHYIPRFLLERFTDEPASKAPRLWTLVKATGRARRASTLNEAVIGHYYRLILPDGTHETALDRVLDHVESEAAKTVRKLSASSATSLDVRDHFRMIQFVITLANRTPRARQANAAVAEEVQGIDALDRLHERDHYQHPGHRLARRSAPTPAGGRRVPSRLPVAPPARRARRRAAPRGPSGSSCSPM